MSSSASPQGPQTTLLERVVSPTPSAKKRFSALQRIKKLGGKLKKSKKAEPIPEEAAPTEPLSAAVELLAETQEVQDPALEALDVPDAPEPATLAQRIRALITSLPTNGPEHPPINPNPPPLDADGRPITPPGAVHVKDPQLLELLSDPEVMNGSVDDGRVSVWEALEALDAPKYRKPTSSDDTPGQSDGEPGDDEVQAPGDVMLYCPLHPTEQSKIELAATKTVQVPLTHLDSLWQSRWNFLWSYTVGLLRPAAPQTKLVTTWVPSTTKISFQALWWGYRMYLPPPVMVSLASDEAEAVKIATTITAALTWFLANISPSSVPPALLPAFLLLQKLGPYAGYIGTFVGWIWGAVTGADKGNGVVLTATWVLPVALIPSAIQPPTTPDAPVPPVTAPPVTTPPVTAPPVTAPPVTAPPVTAPPVTAPPVTAPPSTVPPTTPDAPPATPSGTVPLA